MRVEIRIATLALTSMFAIGAFAGCIPVESSDPGEADESRPEGPVGEAASAQIPPNSLFTLKQSGVTVAQAWAGTIGAGTPTEYWVAKSAYSPSAARTFTFETPQSCSAWKSTVCSSSWTG